MLSLQRQQEVGTIAQIRTSAFTSSQSIENAGTCWTAKDVQGGCLKWERSDIYYLGMVPNADKGFAAWL